MQKNASKCKQMQANVSRGMQMFIKILRTSKNVDHHGRVRPKIYCKINEKQGIVSESTVKQMKAHIWITSQARPALINPPPCRGGGGGGLLTPGGGYP
jgi:hypothetical protein